MSKKDPIRLHVGDKYNPEKRAGQPRKVGNDRYLTTWYTYDSGWRWASEDLVDRMKKDGELHGNTRYVLVEFYRNVYYKDGRFYRTNTMKSPDRSGDFAAMVPLDGWIWTCHPKYQAKYGLVDAEILCEEGFPTVIHFGEDAFKVTSDSWPAMEMFLGLDECYKPEKYRPERVA